MTNKRGHEGAWRWILAAVVFVVLSPVAAAVARTSSAGWLVSWVVVEMLATAAEFIGPDRSRAC